jgi:type I restriction enzyme M protein
VKTAVYDDVFGKTDTISLDAESVRYVVGELQNYCVMNADRDAIGDAFCAGPRASSLRLGTS